MQRPHADRSQLTLAAISCLAMLIAGCSDPKLQEPTPRLDILQVLPAAGSLLVGESASLGALRLKAGLTSNVTADVDWDSDDESVLSVAYDEANGAVVTAVGVGTAHITASDGSRSGTSEFVVKPSVVALELDKGLIDLAQGTTLPLSAVMLTSVGTKLPLDETTATWGSNAPAVASIDDAGVVNGLSVGEATITLTRAGISTSQLVHVRDWTLESFEAAALPGTSVPITLSAQIAVIGSFSGDHTQDITALFALETDADEEVATLEAGVFTAGAEKATATVTGTGLAGSIVEDQSFTLDFTIVDAELSALSIELPQVIAVGDEPALAAISGTYGDDIVFDAAATLSAEPKELVAIDNSRASLAGLGAGDVTITASVELDDGDEDPETKGPIIEASQDVVVVDGDPSSLAVEPAAEAGTASIAVGASTELSAAASYDGAARMPVTDIAVWKSADESIAVVSNVSSGRVTGLAAGTTKVTASYRGLSTDFEITVEP